MAEQLNEKLSSYKQDKFFKRWLNGLSDRTKENYTNEIGDWLVFIGMTPTEQIQKRMHDLTSTDLTQRTFFENKFRQYKTYLEKSGDLKSSAVTTMLIPVASFFSRNSLKLQLKRGDWKTTMTQEAQTRLKLSRDDVGAMYLHANLRDRGLLLTLAQSGLSEVDVSVLRVEMFPKLYSIANGEHMFFEKRREKSGEMQATCISAEALHEIRAMLEERGNPEEGWLFVSQTRNQGGQMDVRIINLAMKGLAIKTFGEEKGKNFKTKALRSFYNSALLRAGVQPQEIKDVMMGHQRRGARGHYDYNEATILENYKKAFEYLGINGIQTRTDVAKLKAEFDTTKSELLKTITQQNNNIESLEKWKESASKAIKDFTSIRDTFLELVEKPEVKAALKKVLEERAERRYIEGKEAELEEQKWRAEKMKRDKDFSKK